MNAIKNFYRAFCRVEEFAALSSIAAITLLVFMSAIMRTVGHPINWAQDASLLLMAWVAFLGADVALRRADFLLVDILISRLSAKVQNFLYYLWYIMAVAFLGMLITYGIPLAIANAKRPFQTLGISYSWATISVPVGAALMIVTIVIKLVTRYQKTRDKEKNEPMSPIPMSSGKETI